MIIPEIEELNNIINNYCVGCGICAIHGLTISMNKYGCYEVDKSLQDNNQAHEVLKICPFSSRGKNETYYNEIFFKNRNSNYNKTLGHHLGSYCGYTNNLEIRRNSSSGGVLTWTLNQLLQTGEVNFVIHSSPRKSFKESDTLFDYTVSDNVPDIINGSSSHYYPLTLSKILNEINGKEGTFVIVALPCFAKGLRQLQSESLEYRDRIKYIITPFCGHLKSANYAKMLALQCGLKPNELLSLNFRKKFEGKLASQYGTSFKYSKGKDIHEFIVENSEFNVGTNWGHGMFKLKSCDYCDDITGEVADISFGDAWLPEYLNDYLGTSIIVVRNPMIHSIIQAGLKSGDLSITKISASSVEQSQLAGIRNKTDDLSYRLYLKAQSGSWFPPKRVSPSKFMTDIRRQQIIIQRLKISELSHEIFLKSLESNNFKHFSKSIQKHISRYDYLYLGLKKYLKLRIKKILNLL